MEKRRREQLRRQKQLDKEQRKIQRATQKRIDGEPKPEGEVGTEEPSTTTESQTEETV
jgi:hypothetical protein